LEVAYKNFFKNGSGFPKYKSRKDEQRCRFPKEAVSKDAFKDDIIPREISIDIEDIPEDPVTTVSMESPFTVESFCEHVSKPIMNTVIACSKLVKKIGTYHSNPTLISTSRLQSV
jgi:transposase